MNMSMSLSVSVSMSMSVSVSMSTRMQVFYTRASAVRECQYVECYHL